jgi:tetratricopeptide (TPR) repeat protein
MSESSGIEQDAAAFDDLAAAGEQLASALGRSLDVNEALHRVLRTPKRVEEAEELVPAVDVASSDARHVLVSGIAGDQRTGSRAAQRVGEAEGLLESAHIDALAMRGQAQALIAESDKDEAAAVALLVLGMAARFDDPTSSIVHLRRAVQLSLHIGLPERAAQARTSLVVLLAQQGRTRAAIEEAELAAAALQRPEHELDLAQVRVNHGLVLQRLGRNQEALVYYDAAEPVLTRHGSVRWEVQLRNLRGTLHAYQGRYAAAEADLWRGVELAESGDVPRGMLMTLRQNLGFALLRSGSIPEALHQLALAQALAEETGRRSGSVDADRAEAFLAAGLAVEALENAERAVSRQLESGREFDAAESRLLAARAALAAGHFEQAPAHAARARADFAGQRRPGWAAWAWQVELAARFEQGERSAELLRELTRCAVRLDRTGWLFTPQRTRLLAARTAAALGRKAQAERLFTRVAAARFAGVATLRTLAWQAEGERRLLRGDRSGAARAVTQGLRVLTQYAGTLGATDLRESTVSLGPELAEAGLRLSVEGGSARSVLVRAEQWRAASLRRAPVRPARSGLLAESLWRLRAVTSQVSDGALSDKDAHVLRRARMKLEEEISGLEAEIRELARHDPRYTTPPESPLDLRNLTAALGGRVLVEYMRLDDELHAIVLDDGRCTRHRIGSYQAVLKELESLRFSMSRIAKSDGSSALLRGAHTIYEHARVALDAVLLDPVRQRIGAQRELVLVPTGSLYALPWAALPSLAGRVLTVAPSARTWMAAEHAWMAAEQIPERPGRVALAHGPGLARAEDEILALARLYPDAEVLVGDDAGVEAVTASWDGARLAHLAAHGRFRGDNPLFTSLELADGPLTVYDLESLGRAPRVLILSACDSTLTAVNPDDELLGVASTLLALGSKTVITTVAPVSDEHIRPLMIALHTGLGRGLRPAAALAAAQALHPDAATFICLGAG